MLTEIYTSPDILNIKMNCKLFHDISDRDFWEKAKEDALVFFEDAVKKYQDKPRGHLTASLYRQFTTTGNRVNYETVYLERRAELVAKTFLECFHNDGRYMEDILDLTWMILEETSWTLPAHELWVEEADSLPDFNRQSIDLSAAETACTMAFVYTVLGSKLDEMSKVVKRRIKHRIETKILDDYLARDDYWWLSFGEKKPNNWNVWINSNVLASAIMLCDDEEKMRKIVYKVMRSVDRYLDNYPEDGACIEGAVYWNVGGLSMLEDLWLLSVVTDGQVDFLKTQKAKNTLEYVMKVYTGNGGCISFSDAGIYLPASYATIYKLAKFVGSEDAEAFAKQLYADFGDQKQGNLAARQRAVFAAKSIRMHDLACYLGELKEPGTKKPKMNPDYYFDSIQIMTSKCDLDPQKGLFLAVKGGHNGENHNHNDIGNFIVYKNGTNFLIDTGNMTYDARTFDITKRYTLMSTRSVYHNLPYIDGFEQKYGNEYASKNVSFSAENGKVVYSIDIKDAYENRDEIEKWERTFVYDKAKQKILVTEDFSLSKEAEYALHFMTLQKVESTDNGIVFQAENGEMLHMDFDRAKFEVLVETIEVTDAIWLSNWGDKLYRVILKSKAKQDKINYLIY